MSPSPSRVADGPAIRLEGLAVDYLSEARGGSARVLQVVDGFGVQVARGECVALIGPSGCGKSTILRVLAGLTAPTAGTVEVAGRAVVPGASEAAWMPQADCLLPWRRAMANATLGARIAGVPREKAERRASELFDVFGLTGFERAWPSQLSGGMRQRLALLRTVMTGRRVMLLDEPFGALDAIRRRESNLWLASLLSRMRDSLTIVLVTHDVEEALLLADRVIVLSDRPARKVDELGLNRRSPGEPPVDADRARARVLAALTVSAPRPRH